MFFRKLLVISTIVLCLSGTALAQSFEVPRVAVVHLVVDKGVPLQIVLTEKVHFKLNEAVRGRIVEPIYAFDREVIPSGTEVLGKVTGLHSVGKWKRVSSMLGGDFTPLRDPEITFDTLVLADGKEIPIQTAVVSRGNLLVRFSKGQTRTFTAGVRQPAKELVHGMLWGLLPYHPQFTPTGTTYKATLVEPLEFGNLLLGTKTLNRIGSEPAAGSVIYARLITPLDSKATKRGASVQAVLTYPLYSAEHALIFPAGSRLEGEVAEVRAAGFLKHGGELGVQFTRIEPPISIMSSISQARDIQGRLVGVEVPFDVNQLHISTDGIAQIGRSNQRFLAPAFALTGAAPMLFSAGSAGFGAAFAETYSSSMFSRMFGGSTGLGLPAGITGLMVPPVGVALGAYGLAYAVYANILGRGKNISLPIGSSIEVRLDRPATE